MKVFISWSGQKSQRVASTLRDWIPAVIQSVEPFLSSEDIDKGKRWAADIASELEATEFGIICLTKENLSAPWVLFEAGALSKSMEEGSVAPFLFDLPRSDIQGPLLQFQSTIIDQSEVLQLLRSINKRVDTSRLDDKQLEKSFEKWWPDLEAAFDQVRTDFPDERRVSSTSSRKKKEYDVMEEVLDLVRTQTLFSQRSMGMIEEIGSKIDEQLSNRLMRADQTQAYFARVMSVYSMLSEAMRKHDLGENSEFRDVQERLLALGQYVRRGGRRRPPGLMPTRELDDQ